MRILAYSVIANEILWTRNSQEGNIDSGEYGISYDGDILELLSDFYRLEYTYSTLKNNSFKGVERRRDAILERVEASFVEVTDEVKQVFVGVFEDWLKKHALTEPTRWAQERVNDLQNNEDSDMWDAAWREWSRYYPRYSNQGRPLPGSERAAQNHFSSMVMEDPEIRAMILNSYGGEETIVAEEVDRMMSDWESSPEDVTNQLGLPEDANEETVRAQAEEVAKDTAIESFLEFFDINEVAARLDDYGSGKNAFFEKVFEKFVFPAWYKYWQAQGIDETRATVEAAYQGLLSAEGLGNTFAAVNIAINTSHQTGSMLDHVENATNTNGSLKRHLDSLTEGEFVEEVNTTLRQIGVQV